MEISYPGDCDRMSGDVSSESEACYHHAYRASSEEDRPSFRLREEPSSRGDSLDGGFSLRWMRPWDADLDVGLRWPRIALDHQGRTPQT
jgi:hypothetical protein